MTMTTELKCVATVKTKSVSTDFTRLAEEVAKATAASDGPGTALREHKALRRKKFQRAVVLLVLLGMMAGTIFLPMHWIAKVIFEIILVFMAFCIWGIDTATEIPPEIPTNREEEILQEELERRGHE